MTRSRIAIAVAVSVTALASCTAILGIDGGDYRMVDAGLGGGTSSTTTSSTASTGTSSTATSSTTTSTSASTTATTSGAGGGGGTGAGGGDGGIDCDAGTTGAVGYIGCPCTAAGALACNGNHSQQRTKCANVSGELKWVDNKPCSTSGNLCDTVTNQKQGTCGSVAPACMNATPGQLVCDPSASNVVACGPDWLTRQETPVTVCPGSCLNGMCVECLQGASRCAGDTPQTCDSNNTWQDQAPCTGATPSCVLTSNNAGCGTQLSCPTGATCGSAGDSCCASPLVEGDNGGTPYYRSYATDTTVTIGDMLSPATVHSFRLDKFEVTVGRFRQFVNQYTTGYAPAQDAGANPHIPGSGWDSSWPLPAGAAALKTGLANCTGTTWTGSGGDNKPINCVTWFEAFAFCAWDGGRLPTEAEWNYAAAGGSEQRVYPWWVPGGTHTINSTYAVYGLPNTTNLPVVGSKQSGNGLWGQADLTGSMREWLFDWSGAYDPSCTDCGNTVQGSTAYRVTRGGSWVNTPSETPNLLNTGTRDSYDPTLRIARNGFRCARDP